MTIEIDNQAPDFIIIGAQKAGTTALRKNLEAHSAIAMPQGELHFFSSPRNWEKGYDWYRAHFCQPGKVQGEKTPDYLSNANAAKRIAREFPEVKLIALLRNPVTRAYSHWNHMMQNIDRTSKRGWEEVSFEEAIRRAHGADRPFQSLLIKGRYYEHLERFAEYFPREQVFIGIQERFLSDGTSELARVLSFLGVAEGPIKSKKRHVRSYASPISRDMRKHLQEYYAPFNQRLFEYLGEDIPEWGPMPGF